LTTAPDLSLTRARALIVIGATEEDLRTYLTEWVLAHAEQPREVFGELAPKLEQRATDDRADATDPYVLVDYLDWADTYQLLNRNASLLPGDVSQALRDLTPRLELVAKVRNKLAHSRRVDAEDLALVEALTNAALASALRMPTLAAAARRLETDPAWSSRTDDWDPSAAVVPNNLPIPDFDETGLIGRQKEMAELLAILGGRRQHVVTLVGEGGVGKTALAVQCLGGLAEDQDSPYVAIVWASLKQHRLTGAGVERLPEARVGLDELCPAIATVFDMPPDTPLEEVLSALEGMPVLIALDNAEAVDADEVLALIQEFPRDTDFLLTSRVGLGQLEKRIPVGPLTAKSAVAMYRQFAMRRGQSHLAQVSQEGCTHIVEALSCRPLGIRWFVEAVAAGREPGEVLANQDELVDYCIETVYECLDDKTRMVSTALLVADRPLPMGEIVALSGFGRDDVQRGLQELDRRSLLLKELSGEGLDQVYRLSELADNFLRRGADDDARRSVQERWLRLLRSDEERRVEGRRGLSPSALRASTGEERAAADLLRRALRASKDEDDVLARQLCEQAEEIAPRYFEVPRVAGFIAASRGRPEESLRSYERALGLAQTEDDEAVVSYWACDVLSRVLHDPAAGERHARRAHSVLGVPDTALRLGRVLMWQGKLDEGERFIREALEEAESGRTRAIARTDLVSLAKRRVELLRGDGRDAIAAVRVGAAGLHDAAESAEVRLADRRMHKGVLDLLDETARAVYSVRIGGAIDDPVSEMLGAIEAWMPYAEPYGLVPAIESVLSWMIDAPSLSEYVRASVGYLIRGAEPSEATAERVQRQRGIVDGFDGSVGYGFIEAAASIGRIYFHRTGLEGSPGEALFLREGAPVSFAIGEWKDRPCAVEVRIELAPEDREASLQGRTGRIAQMPSPDFFFIADEATGTPVFVHISSVVEGAADGLALGDELTFDAVMTDKSPKAAQWSVRPVVRE
jgi:cold shock CspA family protein